MSEFVVYSGVRMRGGIEDGERWDKRVRGVDTICVWL